MDDWIGGSMKKQNCIYPTILHHRKRFKVTGISVDSRPFAVEIKNGYLKHSKK
jgi:hypothetical protein